MLYYDYPLELPKVMPSPNYAIRCQPYKGCAALDESNEAYQATVVLYTGHSRRDPLTKKMVHPKRVTIGKMIVREGKECFVPNERYFEFFAANNQPPVLSDVRGRGRPRLTRQEPASYGSIKDGEVLGSGFSLAWHNAARQLGLDEILNEVFGVKRTRDMLAIAAYYAFDDNRGLTLLEHFARTQMCFTHEIFSSKRASETFADITEAELTDFFRKWLVRNVGKNFCFYDVTSISYTGDSIHEVAWGYNRDNEDLPQLNLGLFVSSKTSLPLFYCSYNGGINDFTNFPYVMSEAKFMGLTGHITIVGDRIFSDAKAASAVYHQGYGLLVGMQLNKHQEAMQHLLAWQTSPSLNEEITKSPLENVTSSQCPYTLNDVPGTLFMYKDYDSAPTELCTLQRLIKAVNGKIESEGPFTTKNPSVNVRRLFDVETIRERGKTTLYRVTPNDNKVMDAFKLCGCYAIFTTEPGLGAFECLDKYRAKDACEKQFANLKNDLIGERILVHSDRAWHGKMFVLFLSLIIQTHLRNALKPLIHIRRKALRAAFVELSDIRCRKHGNRWCLKSALTRSQREMVQALDLPLDCLQPNK